MAKVMVGCRAVGDFILVEREVDGNGSGLVFRGDKGTREGTVLTVGQGVKGVKGGDWIVYLKEAEIAVSGDASNADRALYAVHKDSVVALWEEAK